MNQRPRIHATPGRFLTGPKEKALVRLRLLFYRAITTGMDANFLDTIRPEKVLLYERPDV
jgi:hypothetical protein